MLLLLFGSLLGGYFRISFRRIFTGHPLSGLSEYTYSSPSLHLFSVLIVIAHKYSRTFFRCPVFFLFFRVSFCKNFEIELIGKMIEAREEKGLSQRELAQISGVKQPAIARLESMKTTPRIDTLFKILNPLGYTISIVPLNPDK